MQAIDFATRLAASLLTTPASLAESAVLFALAAGLDTADDIAHTIGLSAAATRTHLHKLTQRSLTESASWTADGTPIYRLSHTGRDLIRTTLSFLDKK